MLRPKEGRRYLYESRVSDFRRELEIDRDGLVVTYPDFWQRG
ncbi:MULTISPECIES: putative glycolipid-binding domain-containing protein [unclassified Mesorhizobium]|nr:MULTISPECIES: putative glycolipid-binding domain-containing protein [unclassified Mesorhizobium]